MWVEKNNVLVKEFEFADFAEALDFVNKVAAEAEKVNHHPDVLLHSYRKVKIMLTTHSEEKVTIRDRELAAKIDSF